MTDGLEYLGRARMQGLTLLLVAFLVGALAGAAGDRMLSRPRPRPPEPRSEESQGRPRLPRVLEDMELTVLQRATIDSILASGRPRNEAVMNQVLPRLRAISDSLQQAIRAVLTPPQAARFDDYLRTHRPAVPPLPRVGGDVREGRAGPSVESDRTGDPRPGPGRDDRRSPPREGAAPPPPRDGAQPPPPRDGAQPPPPRDGAQPPPPGDGVPPPADGR
jgi:hypothetical protein